MAHLVKGESIVRGSRSLLRYKIADCMQVSQILGESAGIENFWGNKDNSLDQGISKILRHPLPDFCNNAHHLKAEDWAPATVGLWYRSAILVLQFHVSCSRFNDWSLQCLTLGIEMYLGELVSLQASYTVPSLGCSPSIDEVCCKSCAVLQPQPC